MATTRKELLKAHGFQRDRLVAALVSGRPNTPEPALRRLGGATIGGVMLGLLVIAVFGVIGFLSPGGSDAWREPGRIVVEKGSGALFVVVDEVLHPVLNLTSARLLTDGGEVVDVAAASLDDAPRGATLGIPGAPALLPSPDDLDDAPPVVCSSTTADPPRLTAGIGGVPDGTVVEDDRAVLVDGGDGPVLLWQGGRHEVTAEVAASLGFGQVQATAPAWLNALPADTPMVPPALEGVGEPAPPVADVPTVVGRVFDVEFPSGETGAAVMTRDGVAELTRTAQALLLATPEVAAVNEGGQARQVTSFQLPSAQATLELPDLPATPPSPAELPEDAELCATRGGDGARVVVRAGALPGAREVPSRSGTAVADRVAVAPGGGAVLRREGAAGGALFLVTDTGLRYAVDAGVLGALGYTADAAVDVPSGLLRLLPEGPPLTVEGAATPEVVRPADTTVTG